MTSHNANSNLRDIWNDKSKTIGMIIPVVRLFHPSISNINEDIYIYRSDNVILTITTNSNRSNTSK